MIFALYTNPRDRQTGIFLFMICNVEKRHTDGAELLVDTAGDFLSVQFKMTALRDNLVFPPFPNAWMGEARYFPSRISVQ